MAPQSTKQPTPCYPRAFSFFFFFFSSITLSRFSFLTRIFRKRPATSSSRVLDKFSVAVQEGSCGKQSRPLSFISNNYEILLVRPFPCARRGKNLNSLLLDILSMLICFLSFEKLVAKTDAISGPLLVLCFVIIFLLGPAKIRQNSTTISHCPPPVLNSRAPKFLVTRREASRSSPTRTLTFSFSHSLLRSRVYFIQSLFPASPRSSSTVFRHQRPIDLFRFEQRQ